MAKIDPSIEILKPTYLKARPLQSTTLEDSQKVFIKPGFKAVLHSFLIERDHAKVAFLDKTFKNKNTWWVYLPHVKITTPKNQDISWHTPDEFRLKVPYFHQLDNVNDPTGTCNVTSVAMCLGYYGYKYTPDQLFNIARDNRPSLDIQSPFDLQKLIRLCGASDNFQISGKIEKIKLAINDKKPCIIHGYFTRSGHIVVIVGYNDKGLIVHDPYGEWFSNGYDTSIDGEYLTYSYEMINRLCAPDGDLWTHVVSN